MDRDSVLQEVIDMIASLHVQDTTGLSKSSLIRRDSEMAGLIISEIEDLQSDMHHYRRADILKSRL